MNKKTIWLLVGLLMLIGGLLVAKSRIVVKHAGSGKQSTNQKVDEVEMVKKISPQEVDETKAKEELKNGQLNKELDSIDQELNDLDSSIKNMKEPEVDFNI